MFLSVSKVILYRLVFASFLISVESLGKEVTRNQGPSMMIKMKMMLSDNNGFSAMVIIIIKSGYIDNDTVIS